MSFLSFFELRSLQHKKQHVLQFILGVLERVVANKILSTEFIDDVSALNILLYSALHLSKTFLCV